MKRYTKRTRDGVFTSHDKRVTLTLARLSSVCKEMPELSDVLQKLPDIDYDLSQLPQADLELLYAEFDEELEGKVRSEFEADPLYLIDLRNANGTCPLCGHQGCRFIFKLQNLKGGENIECGSDCIITYGLSVKGAETAELAKKMLEAAIRKAIKKVKIEEWHKEYGFDASHFGFVQAALDRIISRTRTAHSWEDYHEARFLKFGDLPKLEKFYDNNGWLNTQIRWGAWCKLVSFVWEQDVEVYKLLDRCRPWEPPKKRVCVVKEKTVRTSVPKSQGVQMYLWGE